MDVLEKTAATLASILPPDIAVAAGPLAGVPDELFEIERDAVATAVPSRYAEFATGRTLARTALRALGFVDAPIGVGPDRRPLWPPGAVGTITHSGRLAAAAVASSAVYCGIGIDLEVAAPLKPCLARFIGGPDERQRFATPIVTPFGPLDRGLVTFSIKEAVFKAIYPTALVWFDFLDARVDLDEAAGRFRARLVGDAACLSAGRSLDGRFAAVPGYVLTAIALPRA